MCSIIFDGDEVYAGSVFATFRIQNDAAKLGAFSELKTVFCPWGDSSKNADLSMRKASVVILKNDFFLDHSNRDKTYDGWDYV